MDRRIRLTFIVKQPQDVARIWTSAELRKVLKENLKIWAASVDGELVDDESETPHIVINGSAPTSPAPSRKL